MPAADSPIARAAELLASVRGRKSPLERLATVAAELAELVWHAAQQEQSEEQRARAELLSRMMSDRRGQVFTTTLTDRAHRSLSARRTVSQAAHLLRLIGRPVYLGMVERWQLRLLEHMGGLAPALARSGMLSRIHEGTAGYIVSLPASELDGYLKDRSSEGASVIVNHLGEEVLGEREAVRRVAHYADLLGRPHVRTISVKASSICSQLDALAFAASVNTLKERLRPILRAARDASTQAEPRLVYLDMEGYRDVEITLAAFRDVLDENEFHGVHGGCAIQAYLPDSVGLQQELLSWAARRVALGGAPIRMRLVKGANLAVEALESAQRGWASPVYATKLEVDANFKRLLHVATAPEHARVAHVGVASHNVFDIALALLLRASRQSEQHVGFELLCGMADHLRRVLGHFTCDVLLYTPVVDPGQFSSAIAYLIRRLDENTDPGNFLHHGFHMHAGDDAWQEQRAAFEAACGAAETVARTPRRLRGAPMGGAPDVRERLRRAFRNEPDTDFISRDARKRIEDALEAARAAELAAEPTLVESRIPGFSVELESIAGGDPSQPGVEPHRIALASQPAIAKALDNAEAASRTWSEQPQQDRSALLLHCADAFRHHRAELIALMVLEGGKRVEEADAEVSEAIDFAEYYARSALDLEAAVEDSLVRLRPRGVVVVTPPWNFPLAIPMGGALAAVATGNAAILKPALETPRIARRACELCWNAGVPDEVLQLVVCEDEAGSALISDQRVSCVVLTGATDTARLFQKLRPGLRLLAETGGKNALVVMPMADRELAVSDIVASAFGHAGQKCSALSLLVLHRELYDDARFLDTLRDAAESMKVGSAWDPETRVPPLIRPPSPLQRRALGELDPGERWLLEPCIDAGNPRLVSPGIKLPVRPGSFSHQTEFFCPVLSVMRARDLDHAIDIVNGTPYGLTSGLHSLDERDQESWIARVRAGNLYINRRITGAIVQRQSFGGWKASSFGPGAKAGGPNYTAQLALPVPGEEPPDTDHPLPAGLAARLEELGDELLALTKQGTMWLELAQRLARRYQRDFERHFKRPTDVARIPGQDNILRYVPVALAAYAGRDAEPERLLHALVASWVSGSVLCAFIHERHSEQPLSEALTRVAQVDVVASDAELAARIANLGIERLMVLGAMGPELRGTAERAHVYVDSHEPLASGRLELLWHLREQSISINYHRYGNVGLREVLEQPSRAARAAGDFIRR